MSKANDNQYGGTHYQRSAGPQHWDVVEYCGIPYLEGCASKYVSRWRLKGGVLDLHKASHFITKRLELLSLGIGPEHGGIKSLPFDQWILTIKDDDERLAIHHIMFWRDATMLLHAQRIIEALIAAEPGPHYVNQDGAS